MPRMVSAGGIDAYQEKRFLPAMRSIRRCFAECLLLLVCYRTLAPSAARLLQHARAADHTT